MYVSLWVIAFAVPVIILGGWFVLFERPLFSPEPRKERRRIYSIRGEELAIEIENPEDEGSYRVWVRILTGPEKGVERWYATSSLIPYSYERE